MIEMCKMPKGNSDFRRIRKEGFVYIDKTKYIEVLENTNNISVHFLRPRRFGKTLFTSMLDAYYDIDAKYEFEELFQGTYIYDHPTKEKNSYYILRFDFSGLNTNNAEILEKEIADRVYDSCRKFLKRYHIVLDLEKRSAAGTLSQLLSIIDVNPLYVIIDEYDHFANELLSFRFDDFHDAVSKNGYVRKFYEVLKTGTTDSTIGKIFITGVSPITLDSMTSGFNISTNLSLHPRFNEMMGFTKDEMEHLISMVNGGEDSDKMLLELQRIYDGYMFSEDGTHHVFNPNMSLYYLDYVQTFHKSPTEIIDPNIYSDYKKIENLLSIQPDVRQQEALMDIISGKKLNVRLTRMFEMSKKFSADDFISLLYYLGYLTIAGKEYDETILKVPNQVIETIYVDYFKSMMEQDFMIDHKEYSTAIKDILLKKNNLKFVELIEKIMKGFSSRDYIKMDESHVKLAGFMIASGFSYMVVKTEYPVGKRYVDLAMFPHHVDGATALFELKYIKKKDFSKALLEEKKQEAIDQLEAYQSAEEFKGKDIASWILIFCNEECVFNSQNDKN